MSSPTSDTYKAALAIADQGIPVFPCAADKRPTCEGGFKAATIFPEADAWRDAALVGMPTGEASGLDVLDIDPKNGGDAWFREHCEQIPPTRIQRTRSGGLHLFFKARPGLRSSADRIARGVDVRAEGGYVIRWDAAGLPLTNDREPTEWPQWLLVKLAERQTGTSSATDAKHLAPPSVDDAVKVLEAMDNPAEASRDTYLRVMFAAKGCVDGLAAVDAPDAERSDEIAEAAIAWAHKWPGHDGTDEREKWENDFGHRDRPLAGWRHLLKVAAELGVDTRAWLIEAAEAEFAGVAAPAEADGEPLDAEADGSPADWRSMLIVSDKGVVESGHANILTTMRHHPAWKGALAYDEFKAAIVWLRSPPWEAPRKAWTVRTITDTDFVFATAWLRHNVGIKTFPSVVADCISAAATEHAFHAVREYLDRLRWDGVGRIDTWLSDYLGAADTPLHRAFAAKFLIAAVARVTEPGCKVDDMLILEGLQGVGKSTALRKLFGDEFFADHMPDLHNKDAMSQLQGKWAIEFAELANMSRSDVAKTKAFLSTPIDRFRPSYGRVTRDFPRQCIFAGSVNGTGSGYLRDVSGARRFWPVECGIDWPRGRKVDTASLGLMRDQMWAEAVARYKAGEAWHLETAELEASQAEAAEERFDGDEWAYAVAEIIEDRDFVTQAEIFADRRFQISAKDQTKALQTRLGDILHKLGWKRTRKRINGALIGVYRSPTLNADVIDFVPRPAQSGTLGEILS